MSYFLPRGTFLFIVQHAPLVAIDLVVRNSQGQILLGERTRPPARGYWYVPGGRIFKGESLDEAFLRITRAELGQPFPRAQARLLGVFEHFHPDNFASVPGVSTHYIVLAYTLTLNLHLENLPREQHAHYRWWPLQQALTHPRVHRYTREYLAALREQHDGS